MIFVRSFIYLLGQVVSTVVVSLIALPCFFLPSLTRAKVVGIWAIFNLWTLKWVCGITYRVKGRKHIPQQPSIIMSNHQSAWETLCFQRLFPAQSYILKKSLLWIPFFGWGLAANRPIAIDRSEKVKALSSLVRQGKERLAEGRWLVVFPEGTRRAPGQPGAFQVGGALIACRTGVPVVPVAHNAGLYWPKNSFLKYPGVIDIVIAAPLQTQGARPRDINHAAESTVRALIKSLPTQRH